MAMINLAVAVTMVDGTQYPAAAIIPGDILAFEKRFNVKLGDDLADVQGELEWVLFLAWRPLHRLKMYAKDFEEFCDEASDIDLQRGPEPTPTVPAP